MKVRVIKWPLFSTVIDFAYSVHFWLGYVDTINTKIPIFFIKYEWINEYILLYWNAYMQNNTFMNIHLYYFIFLIFLNFFYTFIIWYKTDKLFEKFRGWTSQPAVSTLLKSLQGTCPTVMLMLCQRCHDVRTMCFT